MVRGEVETVGTIATAMSDTSSTASSDCDDVYRLRCGREGARPLSCPVADCIPFLYSAPALPVSRPTRPPAAAATEPAVAHPWLGRRASQRRVRAEDLALTRDAGVRTTSGGSSRGLPVYSCWRSTADERREIARQQTPSSLSVPRLSRPSLAPSWSPDTDEGAPLCTGAAACLCGIGK